MKQTISQRLKEHLILFLSRHLPPCKTMVAQFSEARERPLTLREKIVLKLHLFTCEACARYIKQIEKMGELVKPKNQDSEEIEVPIKMPDDARERIKAAIEKASRNKK